MVELLHSTPLSVAVEAIRTCWATEDKADGGEKDQGLIKKIIEHDHTSTLEHLVYTFRITELSRSMLQELARHRIASLSVQSTRYTLKRFLQDDVDLGQFLVPSGDPSLDTLNLQQLELLRVKIQLYGLSNDVAKYGLPEAFKTKLTWTINARSLRNFLKLRSSKRAAPEIRQLAVTVYNAIPEDHLFIYEDVYK